MVVVHTRDPAHGRLRRGLTGPGQPGTYETMSRKAAEGTGSNPAYAVQQLRRCLNKELSEGLGSSPQCHTHRQDRGTCGIRVTALNTGKLEWGLSLTSGAHTEEPHVPPALLGSGQSTGALRVPCTLCGPDLRTPSPGQQGLHSSGRCPALPRGAVGRLPPHGGDTCPAQRMWRCPGAGAGRTRDDHSLPPSVSHFWQKLQN